MDITQRRYDLDWLRIVAFGLLILFHVGMFYSSWGWHVKSPHAPVSSIELPMILMSSWRLWLLFFISGVALRFAYDKAVFAPFITRRFYRLFVPLLFGMLVFVMPQSYFELIAHGIHPGGFWDFYTTYLLPPWVDTGWPMITPTWNHLWYVLYILVMTLVLVTCSALTSRHLERQFDRFANFTMRFAHLFVLLVVPVILFGILGLIQNSYGAMQTLWGDWHRLCSSFVIFLLGYIFAKNPAFWQAISATRWPALGLVLLFSGGIAMAHYDAVKEQDWMIPVLFQFHGWFVICTILGFFSRINFGSSKALSYLTAAVFPYYILHQTITIVAGVYLARLGLPFTVEALVLILITFAGCALIYHFIIRYMGRFSVILGGRG